MVLSPDCAVARRCRISIRRLLALQKGVPIAGQWRRHTKACEAQPDCKQCCQRSAATRLPGEAKLREIIISGGFGGFGDVRRAAEISFNMILEARP